MVSLPAFLRFAPVPVRARRDGWSHQLQLRFVLNLARGMSVAEAARAVGRSRQSLYSLRDRPGAEQFAAAWDAAVEFSRAVRAAPGAGPMPECGIDRLWVPRYYRGRLVGFIEREDRHGAMRRLAALDRIADALGPQPLDAPDFETLLDRIDPSRRSKADKTDKTDTMPVRTARKRQLSRLMADRPGTP
jgi:hypothetical protein